MPDPDGCDSTVIAQEATPLTATILTWTLGRLLPQGYSRPFCKRLAMLVAGLLAAPSTSRGDLVSAIADLQLSPAKAASIARRLARILDDPRFAPASLLRAVIGPDMLEMVLASELAAHRANVRSGRAHHARFRPLHLVVDTTTKTDQTVVLVVGLAYRGIVLPLALRTWPHNTQVPEGVFWTHLLSALTEAHDVLPRTLQEHVALLADRGLGVPRLVDLATTFDWAWVLRIQGQVRIRFPDGHSQPVRTLAAHPGAVWFSGIGGVEMTTDELGPTVAVFKDAGWRACQVIAVWDPAAAEPWLLITNLSPRHDRVRDYARRWAIERLFLSWKSHGWEMEASQLRTPAHFERLLSGLVLATWWGVVIGVAHSDALLQDLQEQAQRRELAVYQPLLPSFAARRPDPRPWPARFSLLTWDRKVVTSTPCEAITPAQCWSLPHWQAPIWSIHCLEVLAHAA